MSGQWDYDKQVRVSKKITDESTKLAKKLKAHCIFMAVVFVDKDGAHTVTGGMTIEHDVIDLYRRLIISEQRKRLEEEDDDG